VQSTFPFSVEPRWRSTHKPLHIVKKARRAVFACFSKSKNRTALRIVVSVRAYRAHQHARVPAHAYSRVHSFRIMHGFLRVYMVYAFDRLSPICSHQRRVIALFALRQKKKRKNEKERERERDTCVRISSAILGHRERDILFAIVDTSIFTNFQQAFGPFDVSCFFKVRFCAGHLIPYTRMA